MARRGSKAAHLFERYAIRPLVLAYGAGVTACTHDGAAFSGTRFGDTAGSGGGGIDDEEED